MTKSKVYFADFHVTMQENLLDKLARLLKKAGFETIDFQHKYAAIKIHFGELGNLAFLRPNYVKVIVDLVSKLGGKSFLTDCNTLYVGSRKNAIDHMDTAYLNGFTPFSTGCHVIIGDGLKGTDEVLVPIDGQYVKEAKIGRALVDADVIISLTHFKMHECTGIGGAIKNLGMGCGSRAGKMEMHSQSKPSVLTSACIGCGACRRQCAQDAITITNKKAKVDQKRCAGCGRCVGVCPVDAMEVQYNEAMDVLNAKISEYALAVVKEKPAFHISFVMDVSPFCDCHAENDVPVVGDVGIFASFDPVALDVACAEMVNRQPINPESALAKVGKAGEDYFNAFHPTTHWRSGIDHAVQCGLGSADYELVNIGK